ncbi:MAG: cysteine desulfurase [Lachnospiraceae bacterium]|nr:cysteine desulfurase [Lachnospiraceae bacterium]
MDDRLVYLDNSATTRVYSEVAELMCKIMTEDYGNPSSRHTKGIEAEAHIKNAKTILAKLIKVNEKEILFTSGGTESNNLALIGVTEANKRAGNHVIVSDIEHPSVAETAKRLEELGYNVSKLPVTDKGVVDIAKFKEMLTEDTVLVSTMFVNNETGAVAPIEQMGALIREHAPKAFFHVDAVQAFGKYKIYPKKMNIDLLSVSGHKIHGPKGVGFLYINEKVKIKPIMFGGGQQNGLRSGTDNVPGIAGLALAAQMIYTDFESKIAKMYALKERLIDGISRMPDVYINSIRGEEAAPHIINASFLGVRSEVLLNTFVASGICVSAGSACSSHKQTVSSTLKAMGADIKRMDSAIRFSMCEFTTEEEIDRCIEVLEKELPMLRRFVRK